MSRGGANRRQGSVPLNRIRMVNGETIDTRNGRVMKVGDPFHGEPGMHIAPGVAEALNLPREFMRRVTLTEIADRFTAIAEEAQADGDYAQADHCRKRSREAKRRAAELNTGRAP